MDTCDVCGDELDETTKGVCSSWCFEQYYAE
jgi:hypothetical protein